jgi:nucleotide-binding universal stress UspA family protein
MIKTILLQVRGDETDAECFAAALPIARMFGAHIEALHVRPDPAEIAMTMSTEGAGGVLLQGLMDDVSRDADKAELAARAAFADLCAKESVKLGKAHSKGLAAEWVVAVGDEGRCMTTYGMTADLILGSRGIPGHDATARSTLETVLLDSGRPLLIPGTLPASNKFAERIAIAWKATPQAARAVAGAMPLLKRAEQVLVLIVDEGKGHGDDSDRLACYLERHGIKPRIERLHAGPLGPAETMLSIAGATAELLVMGGYGHTRLRERLFGGFTERALSDAQLPVLVSH